MSTQRVAPLGPVVHGRADYREFELLPRGSVLEVRLIRASGQTEEVVADWLRLDPGQVPIDFELPYDPERVDESHAYSVRAKVTKGDRRLFLTTAPC